MKINGIEVLGDTFAYDGCHKIYICECQCDEEEAIKYNYNIYPIEMIEEIWNNSCGLRFISNWGLDKYYVPQFEDAEFEF